MRLKFFLSLWSIFWLISAHVFAQEEHIHGLVVVDFEDEHPQGVIVSNKQSKVSVETDLAGTFNIKASVGDTLYFKSGFLESRRLAIKPIHFVYDPLIVHMNQEVIQLADIIVRPPLTGDLEKDLTSVNKREEIEKVYANLGIDIRVLDMNPQEKQEKTLPFLGIPTFINVGALIKSINGDYRKMENLRQYEKLDNKFSTVKAYFGESYFEDIIGIKPNESREFLLFVYGRETSLFNLALAQNDYLSLDKLLRNYASKFKKRLKQRMDSI